MYFIAQFLPLQVLITHLQRISGDGDDWMEAKSKQKNALGLPKKPKKKSLEQKLALKKFHAEFSVPFPENIKDITQKVKTLCFLLVSHE